MSLEFILLYSVTVFVASIIPGPSMILALTHGMKYGAKRTVASALGNLTVTLIQATISIAGLGAILIDSEPLFLVIKWVGAAYLIYMGITLWRGEDFKISADPDRDNAHNISLRRMYLQSSLVTAGNPKAIVFFTAIFPQFIDPERAYLSQSAMLLTTGGVIAFVCFMLYAGAGQKNMPFLSKNVIIKRLNKIIGGAFIGVGIGLAAGDK